MKSGWFEKNYEGRYLLNKMHCPFCQSSEVLRGNSDLLHACRVITGSEKRYCSKCGKKWRARPKGTKKSSAYIFAMPVILILSFMLLKLADQGTINRQTQKEEPNSDLPLIMNKGIISKVMMGKSDPRALSKMLGSQKGIAAQMMKRPDIAEAIRAAKRQ